MANKIQVLTEGRTFRDALARLASDGAYSPAERDGFARLHLFYNDRLAAFALRPRYSDASEYYDNSLFWAQQGNGAAAACAPGNGASQQPVYDAANRGGDALDTVTAPAGGLTRGLRGALVPQRTTPSVESAAVPTRATDDNAGPVMLRALSTTPSPTLAAGAVQPPGPTPPPKSDTPEPAWLAKLLTMFPAEAVTVYTVGQSLKVSHVLIAMVTLAALLVVRWVALKPTDSDAPPNYWALFAAGVSFLLWVAATDPAIARELLPPSEKPDELVDIFKAWATFLIVIWLWVVPSRVNLVPPEPTEP